MEHIKLILDKAYTLALAEKTESFTFTNNSTKYDIKIAISQGFDEDGVDSGMNTTTCPVVIVTELKPGKSKTVNIEHLNCRATKAKCSYIWRYIETGYEDAADAPNIKAQPGDFLKKAEWGIKDPNSFDTHSEIPSPQLLSK